MHKDVRMNFIKVMGSSIFQILSFLFVLGYLFGILNVYFNDKNNYCVMTYMFEYPKFVVSFLLYTFPKTYIILPTFCLLFFKFTTNTLLKIVYLWCIIWMYFTFYMGLHEPKYTQKVK